MTPTEDPKNAAHPERFTAAWRLVTLAVVCLFLGNAWRTEADADLWGHLRFGLDTLSTGELARTDPYSYTARGATWTNHEWLSELSFAACYQICGPRGLILLRAFLLAATFAAIAVIVVRRRLSPVATLALALFGITFLPEFYRVRPQMFTYTAVAGLIVACDAYQSERRWPLAMLPILFALWCNFHAGFVAGLGILGIYWCGFVWNAWQASKVAGTLPVPSPANGCSASDDAHLMPSHLKRELTFLVLVMLGCVAATLCNPYGIGYWEYVLSAVMMSRPAITEWGPVWTHHPVVIACYLTAVVVPAACWFAGTRRGAFAETAAYVLVAYLAARHARHIPFVIILGAVVFSRRWTEVSIRWKTTREYDRWKELPHVLPQDCAAPGPRFTLALLLVMAVLGGTTKLVREVQAAQSEGVLTVPSGIYPVAAVAFLEDQKVPGNLYCGFSWGEYCLWHLAPRCPVFCDGRYETVYPREVSDLALGARATTSEWHAIVDRYPTEIVLIPADDRFGDWLADRGDFAEIYRDRLARIFIRRTDKFTNLLKACAGQAAAARAVATQVPFPG